MTRSNDSATAMDIEVDDVESNYQRTPEMKKYMAVATVRRRRQKRVNVKRLQTNRMLKKKTAEGRDELVQASAKLNFESAATLASIASPFPTESDRAVDKAAKGTPDWVEYSGDGRPV